MARGLHNRRLLVLGRAASTEYSRSLTTNQSINRRHWNACKSRGGETHRVLPIFPLHGQMQSRASSNYREDRLLRSNERTNLIVDLYTCIMLQSKRRATQHMVVMVSSISSALYCTCTVLYCSFLTVWQSQRERAHPRGWTFCDIL